MASAGPHEGPEDMNWQDTVRSAWLASRRHSFTQNGTSAATDDDDRFRRCWGRNSCSSCLDISACSWCPFSATCVPNDYRIPALAPAWEGDFVCPHWAERWELRTRPLGCQVSTITSLTALVAGSSTLLVALLLWLLVVVVRRLRRAQWSSVRPWLVTAVLRRPDSRSPSRGPGPPERPVDNDQTPLLSDVR
ncbi:hypothetical protein HMPREF1624_03203 [Sporothrix schenckii ATCC 58251]|uniref:PSI domain-containing protein n=1 Tax=Sporothrix schenckii (strain ATCC 58251 / de Perez 2211183) TaxID=1391915 RepID=U7PVZ9_SPOS1|nr:hypothetical protein HMPREF1624_03203 [Sporothrix schenckii ATCC 58251]